MRARAVGLAMGLLLLVSGTGTAQVAWDAPLLLAPKGGDGFGLFLVDGASGFRRGGIGVLGTYRSGGPNQSVGFRLGLGEDWRGDLSIYGGVDAMGRLVRESSEFPLDMDWLFGAGLGVGDGALLSFPAGIVIGHTFTGDGVRFTPSLTPRVILDAWMGSGDRWGRRRDSNLNLNFAADLGVDIGFQPGWLIRFGATFGDREALGVGLVF